MVQEWESNLQIKMVKGINYTFDEVQFPELTQDVGES